MSLEPTIWHAILSGISTTAIFFCGVIYQKFNSLRDKVNRMDEFSIKCHEERIEVESKNSNNTTQILTEIRYLRELYSELRKELRGIADEKN